MSDKPYTFDHEDDGTLSLSSAVHQALGTASVCWTNMSGTGVFDDVQARKVAAALLAEIDRQRPAVSPADLLHRYSEWLDSEGLVASDQGSDADQRSHDALVAAFLAGDA